MKYNTAILALLILTALYGHAQTVKHTTKQANKTTKMETAKMKVEIWSDMVCPFCYIGKRRYEAAVKEFAHAGDIELVWHSFQLNPDMEQQGANENAYQYLARAKGMSLEQSVKMHEHVTAMAKGEGLAYHFDKTVITNSYNAHRLLQMAKHHHLGDKAEETLFYAYFTEGKNLNDRATLTELGVKIGLNEAAVKEMLEGVAYSKEVDADIKEAASIGISGVPFFVFDRKYAVSGAQPADTFLQTLQRSYDEWKNMPENDAKR
jgi:protein disulfide-isomerase